MRKIFTVNFLIIIILILSTISCSNHKLNEDNIVQVEDLGIRIGVFERRFRMTNVYNENETITPEILKNTLNKVLLPDHLFIKEAYNLGLNEDPKIVKTMLEHNINLIASNHPIHTENISILKEDLKKFYEMKKTQYDFEIIQHNSFYWTDSIYRYMQGGNEVKMPDDKTKQVVYPRKLLFENSTYGDHVPVEIWEVIPKMNIKSISKPIYSGPVWTIVKLLRKSENSNLKEYDKMVSEIAGQLQPIRKTEQIQKFTDDLVQKYNVQIDKENLDKIYKSFIYSDGEGRFDRAKFNDSDLDELIIKTSTEDFNVDFLIFMLNRSEIFRKVDILIKKELQIAIKNMSERIVLYIDALEKKVDEIEIVKDQIQNKENRLLFSKYLNEEIIKKINVTEEDARKFYDENRDKWQGEFKNSKQNIISDLRRDLMYERRDNLVKEFREDFSILYNESALKELSDKLNEEKLMLKNGKLNKDKISI